MSIVKQDYNTLKFRLLDQIFEQLERFAANDVLNSSKFERYNAQIKSSYQGTSL